MRYFKFALISLGSILLFSGIGRAETSLAGLLPKDSAVIVRVDGTEKTASGRYILSIKQGTDEAKKMQQSYITGMGLLASSIGLEVDPEKGLLPWLRKEMYLGVVPKGQSANWILFARSTDQKAAVDSITGIIGTIVREQEPVLKTINDVKVYSWMNSGNPANLKPTAVIAVGPDYVAFSDDYDLVVSRIQSTDGGPKFAANLDAHKDDLIAFTVDPTLAVKALSYTQHLDNSYAALMSQASASGGINVSGDGIVVSMEGKVPPMMGAMVGAQIPAEGPSAFDTLPKATLAAANVTSGALAGLIGFAGNKGDMPKGLTGLLGNVGKLPVAFGITSILPEPCYVLSVKAATAEEAASVLSVTHQALKKTGATITTRESAELPGLLKVVDTKGRPDNNGYLGQIGSTVFYASDYKSAKMMAEVSQKGSLADRHSFSDSIKMVDSKGYLTAWVNTEFISAFGYFYDLLGAQSFWLTKNIAESLKATTGTAASASYKDGTAAVKIALRTQPGIGTAIMGLYTGMFIPAFFVGYSGELSIPRAQEAAVNANSQSRLKEITLGLMMYSNDWGGKYPTSTDWKAKLLPYVKNAAETMKTPWETEGITYQMNPYISGLKERDINSPASTVAFFEWKKGQVPSKANVLNPAAILKSSSNGRWSASFVDGHVKSFSGSEICFTEKQLKAMFYVEPVKKAAAPKRAIKHAHKKVVKKAPVKK